MESGKRQEMIFNYEVWGETVDWGKCIKPIIGCWTCDRKVVGSTPSWVTFKWLVFGRVTVSGQVNHLGI